MNYPVTKSYEALKLSQERIWNTYVLSEPYAIPLIERGFAPLVVLKIDSVLTD